ncbi:hypothetical protein [Paenibacillus phytorum]
MNGFEDHTYRPQGLVTHAEFTAMLTRAKYEIGSCYINSLCH